jgi:hypothetical protein
MRILRRELRMADDAADAQDIDRDDFGLAISARCR